MLSQFSAARRERERKELRLRILEAAYALFRNGGEPALTLRSVAAAIEYSPTIIYSHFPSKAALLDGICEAQFAHFVQVMQKAEGSCDPAEGLKKIALCYVDFGLQNPGHYDLLMRRQEAAISTTKVRSSEAKVAAPKPISGLGISQPTTNPKVPSPSDHLQRAVFKAMAAGCFKAEYRDISLLTQILWSCLHGLVSLHSVRARHVDVSWKPIQAITDGTLETLLNGMLSPAHQLPVTWQR